MMGMNPEPIEGDTYQWGDPDRRTIKWHQDSSGIDYWVPVTEPPEPMNSDYARIRQWLEDGKITVAEPEPRAPPPEAA